MKIMLTLLTALLFASACQSNTSPVGSDMDVALNNRVDSLSYSMGVTMGQGIKPNADDINLQAVLAGLKDGIGDGEPKLTEDEINSCIVAFRQELDNKMKEENSRKAEENLMSGATFLSDNAKREGVKVTASGLQYEVLKAGTGKSPSAASTVVTHYRGTLTDGTQFDSSYDRGEPAEFPLNRVIPGWTEGIQLMKEGAKYKFFIPAELGYGPRGAGNVIPPNSTLIFEVELVTVK